MRTLVATAAFACVATVTLGPNNAMLAASGMAHGIRRTLPMMAGFLCGLLVLLVLVAAGLGAVLVRLPALHVGLKVAGVAYLLWLASRLWRASAGSDAAPGPAPLGMLAGCAFQAINPKAWMMTVSAVGAYTSPGAGYWPSVALLVAVFALCGLSSGLLWSAFGSGLRRQLTDPRRARLLGRAMAVLTAASCLLVLD